MRFVAAVGACETVSRILDASSGCPGTRNAEAWFVASLSVMLEEYLEESLDDLIATLRPAFR